MKRNSLADNGYNSNMNMKLRRDNFCLDGVIYFRVANMTEEELLEASPEKDNEELCEGHKPPSRRFSFVAGSEIVSPTNEIKALTSLVGLLKNINSQLWTTTRIEDQERLKQLNSGDSVNDSVEEANNKDRLLMALWYRLTRKNIVATNIALCEIALRKLNESEVGENIDDEELLNDSNIENNSGWQQYRESWKNFFKSEL